MKTIAIYMPRDGFPLAFEIESHDITDAVRYVMMLDVSVGRSIDLPALSDLQDAISHIVSLGYQRDHVKEIRFTKFSWYIHVHV